MEWSSIDNGTEILSGGGASATACVDLLACNSVSWTAGAWDGETSWSVIGDASYDYRIRS